MSLEGRSSMEHGKQVYTETRTVHPPQIQTSIFRLVHCYRHPNPSSPWLCQHSNQEAQTQEEASLVLRHQPVGVSTFPVPAPLMKWAISNLCDLAFLEGRGCSQVARGLPAIWASFCPYCHHLGSLVGDGGRYKTA